ncbi:barstar family protein [Nocardia huaxiensis]|uniref:Barstar family protein n=2 Tax=Nocardia huaxiensis TaxID=2755382 RepID=A0A7D6VF02_9NOCA|nr:barstar family protein [Nocardia huaxiensis]
MLGSYFLAEPSVREVLPSLTASGSGQRFDVTLQCYVLAKPHPRAEKLWDLWRSGGPDQRNQWMQLPAEDLGAWLEVARSAACAQTPVDAPPGTTFSLDGSGIRGTESFYCALGEAINGPGGYFGFNLDSMRDCLLGGFGAQTPFFLELKNFDEPSSGIDSEYLSHIQTIFEKAAVAVCRVD